MFLSGTVSNASRTSSTKRSTRRLHSPLITTNSLRSSCRLNRKHPFTRTPSFEVYASGLKRIITNGREPMSSNNCIMRLFSHEYPECLFSSHSITTEWVKQSTIASGRRPEHPPSTTRSNVNDVSGKCSFSASTIRYSLYRNRGGRGASGFK